MKIAIIFTGRINIHQTQYNNFIENVVQDNEFDLFVSYNKTNKTELVDMFINLYKPKIITMNTENYFDVTNYTKHPETNKHSVMSMYLSRSNILETLNNYQKKYNCNWDLIISMRADLNFINKINYNEIIQEINNNKLCIPACADFGGLNDQIAFGNIHTMQGYLSVYNSLKSYLDSNVVLHPETLLSYHIKHLNIPVSRFVLNYSIQRHYDTT